MGLTIAGRRPLLLPPGEEGPAFSEPWPWPRVPDTADELSAEDLEASPVRAPPARRPAAPERRRGVLERIVDAVNPFSGHF